MQPKLLIVHIPKLENLYPPIGYHMTVTFPASSLSLLADIAVKAGYATQVLHLGAEYIADPNFGLSAYVKKQGFTIVAFSLHWHLQLFHTLCEIKRVKQANPEVVTVVGGYTAGFFARELVREYEFIDYLIAGEAELSWKMLLDVIKDGVSAQALANIPNLFSARWSCMPVNLDYVLQDTCEIKSYQWGNFSGFKNLTIMQRLVWRHPWTPGLLPPNELSMFYGLPLGRGCQFDCGYCSGSKEGQRLYCDRGNIIYFSPDIVAGFITNALRSGYEAFYSCFDPQPGSFEPWKDLFRYLSARKLKMPLFFSVYGLPDEAFLHHFKKTFDLRSRIVISVECASEEIRRSHKQPYFSNRELSECLRLLDRFKIDTELFFTVGIPGETEADIENTAEFARQLERDHPSVIRAYTQIVELEPGSPWHLYPEKYGIEITRRTLRDFIRAHADPKMHLGFSTSAFDTAVLNFWFCKYLCPITPGTCQRSRENLESRPPPRWVNKYSLDFLWGK